MWFLVQEMHCLLKYCAISDLDSQSTSNTEPTVTNEETKPTTEANTDADTDDLNPVMIIIPIVLTLVIIAVIVCVVMIYRRWSIQVGMLHSN